jgi:maltose alpha-D-glucosyltransferase/alpha-amylase
MHLALATETADPAFKAEPFAQDQMRRWCEAALADMERTMAALEAVSRDSNESMVQNAGRLLAKRGMLAELLAAMMQQKISGMATRIHGDYHLGQVLVAKDDVVIIDFEGEPGRSLAERREKTSTLRDVAGMLRSLDYAASAALDRFATRSGALPERVVAAASAWRERAGRQFIDTYVASARGGPSYPEDQQGAAALLNLFLLQKTLYEISYEAANRPTWLNVPMRGLLDLLERLETKPA